MMSYWIAYTLLSVLTMIAALWDLKYRRIPNILVFPGMMAGICFSVCWGCILERLVGLLVLFLLAYIFFLFFRHWIGMGDMKLWMMSETFLGLVPSFFIFAASQIVLLIYVFARGNRKQVTYGFKMFFCFRIKPDASRTYSLGIFFLIPTIFYVLWRFWKGVP